MAITFKKKNEKMEGLLKDLDDNQQENPQEARKMYIQRSTYSLEHASCSRHQRNDR